MINPAKEDVVEKTKEFTKGMGVDLVFDAAGVQEAVDTGLPSVKPRGTYVNIALCKCVREEGSDNVKRQCENCQRHMLTSYPLLVPGGAQKVQLNMIHMLFGERRYMAGRYRRAATVMKFH